MSTERIRVSHSNLNDDDDISESIHMAESITQSLRSQSVAEMSKSRSEKKFKSDKDNQKKFSPQQTKQQAPGKEHDSDSESMIQSEYS